MTARPFTVDEARTRRRHFARTLGGRLTQIPEYVYRRLSPWPSRHYFAVRLPEGLLVCFECWCSNDGVIDDMRRQAQVLAGQGFRCAFLDTHLSTRWIGFRRLLLVAPPNSAIDFDRVAECLATMLPKMQQA